MKIPPVPPIGHVVAYEYLWASQAGRRDDGRKTYPVALVLARRLDGDVMLTYAIGISHKTPAENERAVEVPHKLARHLGLDAETCWVYTDQLNVFAWPGPDLRPAEHLSSRPDARDSCVIGALPSDWFSLITTHLAESRRLGLLTVQKRTV